MDPNAGISVRRRARRSERLRYLWGRDGPGCFYCRRPLTEDEATFDHIIPKARGGANALYNLRVACSPCNLAKGDTEPDSRLRWVPEPVMNERPLTRLSFLLGEMWPDLPVVDHSPAASAGDQITP